MNKTLIVVAVALIAIVAVLSYLSYKPADQVVPPKLISQEIGVLSKTDIRFSEADKPTLPVKDPEMVKEIKTGRLLGPQFDYTAMTLKNATVIVSPFDGTVLYSIFSGYDDTFGPSTYHIAIQSEDGSQFSIVLPSQTVVFLKQGDKVLRGQKIAYYSGDSFVGKAAGYSAIMTFVDQKGDQKDLSDNTVWAGGNPSVVAG